MGRCAGGSYPPEFWRSVADDYHADVAAFGRQGVLGRLAEARSVPHSTVVGWVRRCRDLGLIDPAVYGAHVTAWKVQRVAEAIGVDPVALADAIVDHASGDLRITTGVRHAIATHAPRGER